MLSATCRSLRTAPRLRVSAVGSVRNGSAIPPRSERFTIPSKSHVDDLRSILSSVQSTLDGSATTSDLVGYNDDWMNKYHGKSPIVVKPRNPEEVSKVIKYCNDNDIAIVPQSGNTGLVGMSPLWTIFHKLPAVMVKQS